MSDVTISKQIQYVEIKLDWEEPTCSNPNDVFLNEVYQDRCIIEVIQNESIRTDFSNANLKGVTFSLSSANEGFLHFVDFSDADLTGIEFSNLKFRGCKFNGTNFNSSNMSNTAFVLCDFIEAKFINSKFVDTVFQNVGFHDAKIIDGSFTNTYFNDFVNFTNADLKGTLFDTVNVAGEGYIDLSCKNNQICN